MARVSLHIPWARSLKDKRSVVRSVKDKIAARFDVRVAEVGGQDTWQRAVLGLAVVGSEGGRSEDVVDEVLRAITALGQGDVLGIDRETLRLGDDR